MKNKYNIICNILLSLTILLMFYFTYFTVISYTQLYATLIILGFLVLLKGMILNDKSQYKKNIIMYFIIYSVALFGTIFMVNRFFSLEIDLNLDINLIPFRFLIDTLKNHDMTIKTLLFNYIGNFLMLVPFTIILLVKNDKFKSYKKMFVSLLLLSLIIETIEMIMGVGAFDIEDLTLNVLGGMLTLCILNKTGLIKKIDNLFYTNLKIPKKILQVLFIITAIVIIGIDSYYGYRIYKYYIYRTNNDFLRGLKADNFRNSVTLDDYEIVFEGVIVLYTDEDGEQYELHSDINSLNITYDKVISLLDQKSETENYIHYKADNFNGYACKNVSKLVFTTNEYNHYCEDTKDGIK